MDLEKTVLERIVPSPEVVSSIQERADRLKRIVEEYIASHGIEVEARFAGSFSKGTFLSNPDLDLFLMFPDTVSEQEMKLIGLQAGEDILHGIRMFSDHPYTRGNFEGLDVDMVPCFRIHQGELRGPGRGHGALLPHRQHGAPQERGGPHPVPHGVRQLPPG